MSNEPEQAITPERIADLIARTDRRLTRTDNPRAMQSACGEYNCECHYEMDTYIGIARYALELARENERWRMAAELCSQDVAFFSGNTQLEPDVARRFCLLCNDVFGWATADAEQVVWDLIPELYAIYQDKGESGLIEWIAIQRGVRPMPEVEESLSRAKQIVAERNQLSQEVERLRAENTELRARVEDLITRKRPLTLKKRSL